MDLAKFNSSIKGGTVPFLFCPIDIAFKKFFFLREKMKSGQKAEGKGGGQEGGWEGGSV